MRKICLIVLAVTPIGLLNVAQSGSAQRVSAQRASGQSASGQHADSHFETKVAPLLKKHCLECHNPQKSRGGLDLTSRQAMLDGGDRGPAFVAGQPDASLLIKMVTGPNAKMPRQADALTMPQVEALRTWIQSGALWPAKVSLWNKQANEEKWWAFQPLKTTPLPMVKNKDWCRQPVDHFILAALEAKNMKPSPPADRATYIRRVTYDLHGLPPTPAEIEAFLKDPSPDAFEKLVDRLLASPRYGERWARHWLDIIHYADTHGFDKDKRRLWAWLFRDWVIRAFNRDMPFRRFLRYQLAGDHLYPDDPDGIIATGFVVAGPWDFVGQVELREGTVAKAKTRVLDRDDMVANAISTFNSMTVHCARCHDHKFDPIPQEDYYQLQAVFAGVERGDRAVLTREAAEQKLALEKKLEATTGKLRLLQKAIARTSSPELVSLDASIEELQQLLEKLPVQNLKTPSRTNGYHSRIEKAQEVRKWVQVDLGKEMTLDAIRLLPARPVDFRDAPGFGFPARFSIAIANDAEFKKPQTIFETRGDFSNPGDVPFTVAAEGVKARYIRVTADKLWLRSNDYIFALAELQAFSAGKNVAGGAAVTALDSIEAGRWSTRHLVDQFTSRHAVADAAQRIELEARLGKLRQQRTRLAIKLVAPAQRAEMQALTSSVAEIRRSLEAVKSAKVYAVMPIAPRPIHLLHRGDVQRKKQLVQPGALSLLDSLAEHFDKQDFGNEGRRRAALANWLADDNNPLTWRSIVNRVWQYHFGTGIVDSPNDFGRNGNRPSHPELLDYLAREFRQADSFKKLHRSLVLSATYRQASTHQDQYARIDADNRLLWRMNRRRLDAESVRDSVLAVSGKLRHEMYGPGFDLFRFKDDHSPVYDHLDIAKINHPSTWRRTVYRFVVRSVPNPFLESLDCADPNISVPVRNTTITALQALAMLNNPFMVEQAEHFAGRLRKAENDIDGQVELAVQLAFGRPATREEKTALASYARRHGLPNLCRVLLNANEFLFVD